MAESIPTTPPPVEALTRGMISLFNRLAQQPENPANNSNIKSGGVYMSARNGTELNGKTIQGSYQEFIGTLKTLKEEDPDIVKRIPEFIDKINRQEVSNKYPLFDDEDVPGSHEEFAYDVRAFLERQATDLCNTRFWQNSSESECILLREHLERLVMSRIYEHVFSPTESHRARDDQLSLKIRRLRMVLNPVRHLDMKAHLNPTGDESAGWQKAAEELTKMSTCKTPRDKINCITNACRTIVQIIKSKGETPIPDVFIPCLIYVVIQANPSNLHSNVEYLAAYRGQEFMRDERGHFFLHLASSVNFIWRADCKALSMSAEEFDNAMQQELPIDGVLSEKDPSSSNGHSDMDVPSVEWFHERFRFANIDEHSIKVSEVPELLREYKKLVDLCKNTLLKHSHE